MAYRTKVHNYGLKLV